ncbi:MAG: pyrimidine 5'-nucleotidase [Alphaproteobacteria bacterium]|nr:pyrimidine 5'-nucleotidase [Alphaproteobacteria bacterium]
MQEAPDFRHIDTWIFDLDNTLYPADCELFAQIEERMTRYIADRLHLSTAEATRLRHTYYRTYGSTLCGLIAIHGVDPEPFLAHVHDVDLSILRPNDALNHAVGRLRGRRFVFTNGCRHHAWRVLNRLGLERSFDDIWDIRTVNFVPKPQVRAYEQVVAAAAIAPKGAAMFEDIACNLLPAHALGMTTVWIRNGVPTSDTDLQPNAITRHHINHEIDDLAEFLHAIRL